MPWRTSVSIAARNAASVLPEPVGAAIRTFFPSLIAGQASACAGVGAPKLRANQSATAGWNSEARVMRGDGDHQSLNTGWRVCRLGSSGDFTIKIVIPAKAGMTKGLSD